MRRRYRCSPTNADEIRTAYARAVRGTRAPLRSQSLYLHAYPFLEKDSATTHSEKIEGIVETRHPVHPSVHAKLHSRQVSRQNSTSRYQAPRERRVLIALRRRTRPKAHRRCHPLAGRLKSERKMEAEKD